MKDIIKLNKHTFLRKKVQSDKCKTYKVVSPYSLRYGYTENDKKFVDPSGGPFIVEGDKLNDKYIVKLIEFIEKEGVFIEFE